MRNSILALEEGLDEFFRKALKFVVDGHDPAVVRAILAEDLMILLMCFFVLMLSLSEMDAEKAKVMSGSLTETFGVQSDVTATDTPRGTSVEAAEFSPALPEPTTENEVRRHTALARLGKPAADMTGAITVSGHTDNVPIRSAGSYRSNWRRHHVRERPGPAGRVDRPRSLRSTANAIRTCRSAVRLERSIAR